MVEKILKELVGFPVLGGESNLSILAYIEGLLTKAKIDYTLVPNEDGTKKSIHCRIGPAVDEGIILSGHMDVVPIKDQEWKTDPFVLTDGGDGNLYGRGSCDMKGFLACCLASIPEFQSRDLKKPIYLAFSYDEEIGCLAAPALAQNILATYKEKPKFALIGEPSRCEPINGQKGICVIETIINGSAGHSSRIRSEVSAIHEMSKIIRWLDNKMESLIHNGRIDNRFQPPHSSLHVGKIKGGIAPNVIADSCSIQWDVRVIPGDSMQEILADYYAFCEQLESEKKLVFADFQIITNLYHPSVPPLDTDLSSEIVQLAKQITGNKKVNTVAYAAEASQFAAAGFQSIICGPGDIAQAHRANEYISKAQLEKGMAFLTKLSHEFSK